MAFGTGAIRAGRAFVELFADDRKLVKGLAKAGRRLKYFGRQVSQLGARFVRLGVVMAAPFAYAAKKVAGFDDAMAAVQAVSRASAAEMKRLRAATLEMAEGVSYTASQLAAMQSELAHAGFNTREIEDASQAILDLARGTGTELARAAEIAAAAMRSFGLQASDMTHIADVLVATENNSAQSLDDLGGSLEYAQIVAKDFSLSLEDTAKSLGVLANFAIKGSMAGTALRRVMLRLAKRDVRRELDAMKVSVTDASDDFRGLGDILTDLGKAMATMGGARRLALMDKLFGSRGISAAAKLSSARFQQLDHAIDNASGSARKAAVVMDNTLGGSFRKLWSAIDVGFIKGGDQFKDVLDDWAKSLRETTTAVTAWIGRNRELVVGIVKFTASLIALGAVTFVIGKVISLLGTLAIALKAVVLYTGPVGLLVLAIGAIAGYAIAAGRETDRLADSVYRLRLAHDARREAEQKSLARLGELEKKQNLTNAEMDEAADLIKTLEDRHGKLAVVLDRTSGALYNVAAAQHAVNEAQRIARLRDVTAEIEEQRRNLNLLRADMIEATKGAEFRRRTSTGGDYRAWAQKEAEAREKWKKAVARLRSLVAERQALERGQAAPTKAGATPAAPGGKAAAPGGKAADDGDGADTAQSVLDWSRRVAELEARLLENQHDRQLALIEERYKAEIDAASDNVERLVKVEYAKELEIQALDRQTDQRRRELAAQTAQLERAADRQRAEEMEERNRRDADQQQANAELRIQATKKGLDAELALLDLREKAAVAEAERAGAHAELVREEYDLRRQLARQRHATDRQIKATVRGTLGGSLAAIQALQSGPGGRRDKQLAATQGVRQEVSGLRKDVRQNRAAFE